MADGAGLPDDELREALRRGWVETFFQPIVRVRDGVPVGLEALARLNHPDRGTLEPDLFVPRIEQAGLSLALADQVTAHALSAFPPPYLEANSLSVAVNLPLDVLLRPDALPQIDALRRRLGVRGGGLSIELTESRPVEDLAELGRTLERWRLAGYGLALDDVSPGMPHHRALLGLPFTAAKLDKGAVRDWLGTGQPDFVPDTVRVAHAAGLRVIAEGVEDVPALLRLVALGVDEVQGFLVARPLAAAAVPGWLADWSAQALPPDQASR